MTGSVTGPLVIGNEARLTGNSSEGLLGLIDEVSISKVARGADAFLFEPLDLETDTDRDLLPDAWEQTYFGNRSLNGGADPDGDGFGNLQEKLAGTNPSDASSRPTGTAVKLVPLDDGDHATSDFGYTGPRRSTRSPSCARR